METIDQLKQLKNLHPSQEWLDATRYQLASRVFDEEKRSFWQWLKEPQFGALVFCVLLILVGGPWLLVKASETSLPGELLYSVKKVSENIQTSMASEETKSNLQVGFADRRLQELNKMADNSSAPVDTDEAEAEKVKQVVESFRNNLADASAYVGKASKDQAIVIARKTQKIKDELDKTKEGLALAELQTELAEAEEQIDAINYQILAALMDDEELSGPVSTSTDSTSTDEEIIIFLEDVGVEVVTTSTGEIIEVKKVEVEQSTEPAAEEVSESEE